MKISCARGILHEGLSVVRRAVPARSTLPVLSNILLSTDGSRLKLAATDLVIGINCWIGVEVEQEGAITVPARLLTDFVGSLPPEQIDLEFVARTQALNLKCGRFEANIKGIDAQEFPAISAPEDVLARVDAGLLCQAIDQVAFAAGTDESRPVLTGVLAEFSEGRLALAAADGFRLSVRSIDLDGGPGQPTSVIIPARSLQELRRIVGGKDAPVDVSIAPNRNQVFFHMADVDLVSQLVKGTFPDYKQIIPATYNTRTTADTGEFLAAVRMAFVFARESANIVRVQMVPGGDGDSGRLIVSAASSEHGDNVGELDAAIEGPPAEVAFNARYLIDALGVVGEDRVILETRDPASPGVMRPAGGGDFVHIVMPIRSPGGA